MKQSLHIIMLVAACTGVQQVRAMHLLKPHLMKNIVSCGSKRFTSSQPGSAAQSDTAKLVAALETMNKNLERMAVAQEEQAEHLRRLVFGQKVMTNRMLQIHNWSNNKSTYRDLPYLE